MKEAELFKQNDVNPVWPLIPQKVVTLQQHCNIKPNQEK
jgi:hypothetical protein